MYLRGQAPIVKVTAKARKQAGYAMAALLVAIAVLTIMLSVAMPVWRHEMQREREAELVFRGEQYVRAIDLFQRKYAGALPPTIDLLVTERFLRKKYKDPMAEDGEFRIIAAGAQQQPGAPQPGGPDSPGQQPRLGATVPPPMPSLNQQGQQGRLGQPPVGAGIIGVASKSKEKSIRIYKGRTKYDEWQFIFANVGARPGAPGQQNLPGMRPGFPRPGQGRPGMPGQPGTGDPLRRRPGMNPPVARPGGPGPVQRPPG
jgi:type II secretory pathway pseudopilin PulG